jgi:hypothetical protein
VIFGEVEIVMKKDFGKYALILSLASWATLVVFTILSWAALAVEFADHEPGSPRPLTPLTMACVLLAFVSYPMSLVAFGLALAAFYRRQSVVKGIFGLLISGSLLAILSVGLWVAAHGGV